jgi:NADPH:quinone reductase-like Zn-dependent oxidoreductase
MAANVSETSVMHAVVLDPSANGKFVLRTVPRPEPGPGVPLIRVAAFSLNRGEVRDALAAPSDGTRLGWDIAGTIERAATDGGSPPAATRVVALDSGAGWAEFSAVPNIMLAPLPAGVSFEQAATLPVAGLTAWHALRKGGQLRGKRVLVNGASGGVGSLACQLARHLGAEVVAAIRDGRQETFVRKMGAERVAVGPDLSAAKPMGPFHLILESVGGPSLGAALGMLAPGGTCVLFGVSQATEVTFDAATFYRTGATTLYGLALRNEFQHETPSAGLERLLALTAEGKLSPPVEVTAPWTRIAEIAAGLMERRFLGKAVLTPKT